MVLTGAHPRSRGENLTRDLSVYYYSAHPRSRGENVHDEAGDARAEGSSPLTRGKPGNGHVGRPIRGLIPAHAGKTRRPFPHGWQSPAHPRSRGENSHAVWKFAAASGSSPLTRGKLTARVTGGQESGLIPAHAGKTRRGPSTPRLHRAHPRSRGENTSVKPRSRIAWGSSPLTRGKRRPAGATVSGQGLIPAHAGKTHDRECRCRRRWAHPRSRGENIDANSDPAIAQGSSPLTRGKPRRRPQVDEHRGLIPAHAGKTLPELRFYRADRSDLGKP